MTPPIYQIEGSRFCGSRNWVLGSGNSTLGTRNWSRLGFFSAETRTGDETEASLRCVVGRSLRSRPGALTGGADPVMVSITVEPLGLESPRHRGRGSRSLHHA